jgi:hypothetical protein
MTLFRIGDLDSRSGREWRLCDKIPLCPPLRKGEGTNPSPSLPLGKGEGNESLLNLPLGRGENISLFSEKSSSAMVTTVESRRGAREVRYSPSSSSASPARSMPALQDGGGEGRIAIRPYSQEDPQFNEIREDAAIRLIGGLPLQDERRYVRGEKTNRAGWSDRPAPTTGEKGGAGEVEPRPYKNEFRGKPRTTGAYGYTPLRDGGGDKKTKGTARRALTIIRRGRERKIQARRPLSSTRKFCTTGYQVFD